MDDANISNQTMHARIEVLSTFVADPVVDTLRYWVARFGYEITVDPAVYGQVFQRLLQKDRRLERGDTQVVLFSVRDLVPAGDLEDLDGGAVHENIIEFIKTLRSAATAGAGARIVVRCPDPPGAGETVSDDGYARQAAHIAAQLLQLPGTRYVDASALETLYDVGARFDPVADTHAHMPYTDTYYSAIGTEVFRAVRARLGQVFKLLVADCDGTLWEGICGESGPDGILLKDHHRWLHDFLHERKADGFLLSLCSQNNYDDVEQVFTRRKDLGLSLNDFVCCRINWDDKAANIRDIAQELNIGLDSVIFLDDDPVQRHNVRTHLPQVLVPELPAASPDWPRYLAHVWAFDTFWVTGEGRIRAALYQEHNARKELRADAATLAQFLAELRLQVTAEAATQNDFERIFELMNRVNQFNINGLCRSAGEESDWMVVHVKDRFGDYGLVGAVSLRYQTDHIAVDSFLLSCRALGRGVEREMVRETARRALDAGVGIVRFFVAATGRNAPAMEFLQRLGMSRSDLQAGVFSIDAAAAAALPDDETLRHPGTAAQPIETAYSRPHSSPVTEGTSAENLQLLEVARRRGDISGIGSNMRAAGQGGMRPVQSARTVPGGEVETKIAAVFTDLLGHDNISVDQEFFDVGGHSLLAMRLLSRISETLGVEIPIRTLFMESLTIRNLARIVAESGRKEHGQAGLDEIKTTLDSFSDEELADLFADFSENLNDGR